MNIELNKEFTKKYIVRAENSAKNMGSGDLEVLATPALVAFVENCAKECLNKFLEEGYGSVGGEINLKHLAPTLIGKEIVVTTKITEVIKEKIIIFTFDAYEDDKHIASGNHTRAIINNKKFLERLRGE